MVPDVSNENSSFYVLLNYIPKITILNFYTTACSGAERQICTLSARGFELASFRLLDQRSNHLATLPLASVKFSVSSFPEQRRLGTVEKIQ